MTCIDISMGDFVLLFLLIDLIGQLPLVSGEDPERIRVDSVVETLVLCSLFFVSKFSHFLYSTVQKSAVQYSIGRTWSWPVMSTAACFTLF